MSHFDTVNWSCFTVQYLVPTCYRSVVYLLTYLRQCRVLFSKCTLYCLCSHRNVMTSRKTKQRMCAVFRRVRKIAKSDYERISFVMSVCPHGTTRLPLDGFSLHLSIFRKSVEKIQVSLKYDKNNGHFTWRPGYIYVNISLISSYNETKVEKIKTHMLCSVTFFF